MSYNAYNVLYNSIIERHPTIEDIVSNEYLKVMFQIPKIVEGKWSHIIGELYPMKPII